MKICKAGLHRYEGMRCQQCRFAANLLRNADSAELAKKATQRRLKKHGLKAGEPEAMLAAQGHMCANEGCKSTDPGHPYGWHIDHCHATGKVRAILCRPCNLALGHAKECEKRLIGLASYVKSHCRPA